ncbi:MAG: DUF1730 domain-containing protein [Ruminococcaceae bacterium]|nr:DUF1730 domain-containing protein [Oscillospiraceae bacterium]
MYRSIFLNENIEFCASLPLSECRINKEHLLRELCFEPKNVLIFLVPYFFKDERERNISLYAVPRDYHFYMKELFERILPRLKELYPQSSFKGFSDHSPIYEREAAAKAGLGIIGDNGLLINGKYGSYVFIGEIITDASLPYSLSEIKGCHHCGKCSRACPKADGECLSAIGQKKGELTETEQKKLRLTRSLWGCDICQSACPLNEGIKETPIPFFTEERIPFLTREILDGMTEEDFKKRAYSWRGRAAAERNIEIFT